MRAKRSDLNALLLAIRFHEPRYHGSGAWPPAPMRLFQALVAGAAEGAMLRDEFRDALKWLERLCPPEIVAPNASRGTSFKTYVPNNDADIANDPTKVVKPDKTIRAWHFDLHSTLYYLWAPINDCPEARSLCILSEQLHHLGRGVDPAWCEANLLPEEVARDQLLQQGVHHRPSGENGTMQAVPMHGTLCSLERRFTLNRNKLATLDGKRAFSQPPKARSRIVSYGAPPHRILYELRSGEDFLQIPPSHAAPWTSALLRRAAERLNREFPDQAAELERMVIGRGADASDKHRRLRLIPLPSIGNEYVARNIRRMLLEIPQECPIRRDTLLWAFNGLELKDGNGVLHGKLVRTSDAQMQYNYERLSRQWQTETPVALGTSRRRLGTSVAKSGQERAAEHEHACSEIRQALRHAKIDTIPTAIEVQREPFISRGTVCTDFDSGRFDKQALWHVRLLFERPLSGPLVIGNGRFTGLGVMSPVEEVPGILSLRITEGLSENASPAQLVHALRCAMMARVRDEFGVGKSEGLPEWFTGHAEDGTPLNGGSHNHLAIVSDLPRKRLLIIPPHYFDPQAKREFEAGARKVQQNVQTLVSAMEGISVLRAGSAGVLGVRHAPVSGLDDPVLGKCSVWESMTPYASTRHLRREPVEGALVADVERELNRRGLPRAEIELLKVIVATGRPMARMRLRFATAQTGPILLGRTFHKGGGVFAHSTKLSDEPST